MTMKIIRTTKLVCERFLTTSSGWFAKMVESYTSKRAVVLFLFAGILLSAAASEVTRARTVIFLKVAISPDGRKMAFVAGPKNADANWPELSECKVFVLDLTDDGNRVTEIPNSRGVIVPLAWHNNTSPPELFMIRSESEPNLLTPICLLGVRISNIPSTIYSHDLTKNALDKVEVLSWSPDGKILAVGHLLSGLYLSYDGGSTFVKTGIGAMSVDDYVWITNQILYLKDDNKIHEIELSDGQAKVRRSFGGSGYVRLCGSLGGKVVYRVDDDIYCGDKVLYPSSERIGLVFADGSYLAFQSPGGREGLRGSSIYVLDKEGRMVSEKKMPSETIIVGLSSKRKFVYLLKDLRCLQRYSIDGSDKISTIYQVAD